MADLAWNIAAPILGSMGSHIWNEVQSGRNPFNPLPNTPAGEKVRSSTRPSRVDIKIQSNNSSSSTSSGSKVSHVAPTATGTIESVVWGPNPFRNLARFSRSLSSARTEAGAAGVQFNEPIELHGYSTGTIWSATNVGTWDFDNAQGRCRWYAFPTISPYEYDDAFRASWGNAGDVLPGMKAYIETFINKLEIKNTYNEPCELDVFACYPRADIPITQPETGVIGNPYAILYNGTNASELGPDLLTNGTYTSSPYVPAPTGAVPMNGTQYDYTPYDNPWFVQLFNMKPIYHRFMAPGDVTRASFGITSPKRIDPMEYLVNADYVVTTPVSDNFAYRREMGPIFLVRVRGSLVQGEGKFSVLGGSESTYGQQGSTNKPVVNYGNFSVSFIWRSDMICRPGAESGATQRELGYYGGLYPQVSTLRFPIANEKAQTTNAPGDVTAAS